MKIIHNLLDISYKLFEKNKFLSRFKGIITATDEFFFGTDKVTAIPHIVDNIDIKRFMSFVIIGLMPATIASVCIWGIRVLLIIFVSYAAGGIVEVLFASSRRKEIHEGFLVTGLIFPLTLPPTIPLWMVAAGVMFGTTFGKEVFGGTGRNIFNAAIVGRVFLSIAFPGPMSTAWQVPFNADAVTSATPLTIFKNEKIITPYIDLLFGRAAGSIGETFRIGLILGGIFLILVKISNWRIPFSYLGSVFLFSFLGSHFLGERFAPPLFQLLSGGLLLGAFFMATDPVTCPFTKAGKWIAGVLLGLLTVLIRALSGFVEGVMFSILLMNVFTPLIDTLVLRVKYRKI